MLQYQPRQDLLKGKTILITGAGDGIGREAALTYSRFGARLILVGRTKHKLDAVSKEITELTGKSSEVYLLDLLTVTSEECHELANLIAKNHSYLDGVLHNAGLLGVVAPITEQPTQLWHDVMQVNVNATFMLTQALLPLLLKAPASSLVFTSSSVGKQGRIGWGAYAVSKFATEGLMQVLAEEYKQTNLRVNCINPGGTRTSMRASAFPDEDSQKLKTPAEIMPIYIYLMGDDSLRKTGTSYDAQPGRKAGPAE
ncbi:MULTISPECIES: YciK family oxidoreductase [Providencia]|uniref:Putative oxidoreductase n=1 Tax=Providencia heimbachae ATCC 35613 TaxID=1354272 RepID=A0A1B7K4E7_9GAMM|nr:MULTISPECIES: YciK family oxidoreductase [Providencia]MBP6121459.1 YciK family oxidoreductase [Providencia sp.]MDD9338102.1 YciK family oxidoreductase [Providencia heimbachae]NIH22647.1 YciK family oxidoreductase [Providencia heimbachae]OAT55020.1 putative oxidoreductase [Providencia heimbachae ATCC 35613]QCJ70004.1 YciK family oxidoreductase [Providencia heimbachae]